MFCFQYQADCKEEEIEKNRIKATRWCGKTFDDMSDRCHKACPEGTDEECDAGEKCFADSLCASDGTTADIEAKMAASVGKMWCGKSYKHLVENCSQECPNGSDDECGDGMTCFNMSEEEKSCSSAGVGIKAKTDPANLWCGKSWLDMLENCPKPCPEGTDEECGDDMICYDMSNEAKVCEYMGYGVKERDDPNKRFCGKTFAHMHESCPKKCPSGGDDDCPGDMKCFGGSDCVYEGIGVAAAAPLDPSSMYCGAKFEDAAKCGTPCPSGDSSECSSGESCYADVVCSKGQTTVAKPMPRPVESKPAEEPEPEVSEPVKEAEPEPAPSKESASERPLKTAEEAEESAPAEDSAPAEESAAEEEPKESDSSMMYCGTEFSDASKCSTACPSGGTDNECPSGESCYADVVCGKVFTAVEEAEPEEEESAPEGPPSKAEVFMDIIGGDPQPFSSRPGGEINLVENLGVIMYGLPELTSVHVYAFERHTATYLEGYYNTDSPTNSVVRDSVSNLDTTLYVTKVEGPSRSNLRSRRALLSAGYRMIYIQRISYDADLTISLEQVLEHPLDTPKGRNDYIKYLKTQEPNLFSPLSAVSPIILTDDMFVEPFVEATPEADTISLSNNFSFGNNISSGDKFKGFKCHNSGRDCPSGECNAGDICMFFTQESGTTSSQQLPSQTGSASVVNSSQQQPSQTGSASAATSSQQQPSQTEPASVTTLSQQQQQQPSLTESAPPLTETAPTYESKQDASIILDSVLDTQAIDNGSVNSDSYTQHATSDVYGEMVIHGTNLVVAEHLKDWETFTSVYMQNFYNRENSSRDYVQSSVTSVQAQIEMLSVEFGTAEVRTTTIKFKVPISWKTTDDSISFITIVSQPFMTREYRQLYIGHMKSYLPGTFSVVTDVSSLLVKSLSDVTPSSYDAANSFFCGAEWPLDCNSATRCNHADDCPASQGCFASSGCFAPEPDYEVEATINNESSGSSQVAQSSVESTPAYKPAESAAADQSAESTTAQQPAVPSVAQQPAESTTAQQPAESTTVDQSTVTTGSIPCSLCQSNQVISSYSEVTFNRKVIHCAGAFDSVSQFEEGSASCMSAKDALAKDCCIDLSNNNQPSGGNLAPVVIASEPQPAVIETVVSSESSNVSESSASVSSNASESSANESSNAIESSTSNESSTASEGSNSSESPNTSESSNESSNVGSGSTTETAFAINDQWDMNQSYKPAAESTSEEESEGTGQDYTQASWFAEWETSYKMKSSSCRKSVGVSTVLYVIVLGMNLAWN